jgi:hypothetical protein
MPLILSGDTGVPASGMPTGSVIQTVQGTLVGGSFTSSNSFVDSGLTVTITPMFATSKILVMFNHPIPIKSQTNSDVSAILVRNSTTLVQYNDALFANGIGNNYGTNLSGLYLDSPATTSATIYKTQFCNGQGTSQQVYIQSSGVGSITVMEIKA